MTILALQDLNTMRLPVDLSGYDPVVLNNLLRQAEDWVNGEARHANGFSAHRVVDRLFGTGTNVILTNFYPVCTLNAIQLIFPANQGNVNLPGSNQVPISPDRVVIDHQAGILTNWSPFIFQTLGYQTVFPEHVPINVDYYTGYVSTITTTVVPQNATYIPVVNASAFYYNQTVKFYDANFPEFVTVLGTTCPDGINQAVVLQDPVQAQAGHPSGSNVGDMPPEVRLATAHIVSYFAVRELNPENLYRLKIGDVEKQYQRELPVRGKQGSITGGTPAVETEHWLVKEARRELEHYYTDRGIR